MRLRTIFLLTALVGLLGTRAATAATTELVSVGMSGAPADGESTSATITADGHWVVFASSATNLVVDDNNTFCGSTHDQNCADIFVRDRHTQATTLVSVDSSGA